MYYGKDKNLDIVSFLFPSGLLPKSVPKKFCCPDLICIRRSIFFSVKEIQNVAKVKPDPSIFFSDSSNNPGKESLTFM